MRHIHAIKLAAESLRLEATIVIGGDGTQWMAKRLAEEGLAMVGIPKTIDNDLCGTDITIGFSTAVDTATDAASKLRSSADAHNRIMVLEVMGRDAGHIALATAVASGAHAVLLPEIPFERASLTAGLEARKGRGKESYLVVVAEGAHSVDSRPSFIKSAGGSMQLGGIGQQVATHLSVSTGIDARVTVLGHLQRGGMPNATDRILAASFGVRAVDLVAAGAFGHIVCIQQSKPTLLTYASMSEKRRLVPAGDPMLRTAQALGISLGTAASLQLNP